MWPRLPRPCRPSLDPSSPSPHGVLPQKMLALPVGSGAGFRFMVSFVVAFLLFPLPPTEPLFSRFIACRRQVFETHWAGVSKTSVLETGAMQQLRSYGSQPSASHPPKHFKVYIMSACGCIQEAWGSSRKRSSIASSRGSRGAPQKTSVWAFLYEKQGQFARVV